MGSIQGAGVVKGMPAPKDPGGGAPSGGFALPGNDGRNPSTTPFMGFAVAGVSTK